MRSRCDPFDAPAIRAKIAKGETTERGAYAAYASTAAHPYARSSFDVLLRSRNSPAESAPNYGRAPAVNSIAECPIAIERNRRKSTPVKPSNVLTLSSDNASLSVKRGSLIAATGDITALVYEPRAVKPLAIVMTGWGGFITMGALRFCAKHKIAVIKSPRWPLAYDAIELLRPHVEAAVFDFIDERAFAPDEFVRVNDGTVKTNSDLSVEFLDAVARPQVDLDAAVFRLSRLLQA